MAGTYWHKHPSVWTFQHNDSIVDVTKHKSDCTATTNRWLLISAERSRWIKSFLVSSCVVSWYSMLLMILCGILRECKISSIQMYLWIFLTPPFTSCVWRRCLRNTTREAIEERLRLSAMFWGAADWKSTMRLKAYGWRPCVWSTHKELSSRFWVYQGLISWCKECYNSDAFALCCWQLPLCPASVKSYLTYWTARSILWPRYHGYSRLGGYSTVIQSS